MRRREFLLGTGAVAAAGLAFRPSPTRAAERGPIRIGFFIPLTGTFAQPGRDVTDGFMLFWDEVGHQVAGRKIEVIVEDDEGVAATSLTKVRRLVEREKVHTVAGAIPSTSAYAVIPYMEQQRMPTLFPATAPDDLTQRRPARWVVRTTFATSQATHPLGDYAYQVLGLRRVAILGMDFSFGWESAGGFQRVFEDLGGRIVQRIWTPLNTQYYAPYLTTLKKDIDGIFAVYSAGQAQRFLRQWSAHGLKGKGALVGAGTTTDESILPGMADEPLGVFTSMMYSAALDTEANRRFVTAFERKHGRATSLFAEEGYTGARFYYEAFKALNGDVEDKERLLQTLRRVEIPDAPRGPMRMDDMGNPDLNIYIRKVERVGGKLENVVVKTYPLVSQFWTYKKEDYLKQPLYDRSYPPCRSCE